MNTKGRITYRFDKENGARVEPAKKETQQAPEGAIAYFQEELKFTSDVGSWNSPFQNDAQALEQLIREADGQLPKSPPKARMNEQVRPDRLPIDSQEPGSPPSEANDAILLGDEERAFELDFEQDARMAREVQVPAYSKRGGNPQVIDMYPQIEIDEELYNQRDNRGRHAGFQGAGSGKRPAQGPSWFKVFASVAAAIATGALFGYFVLTLFTGGGSPGAANETADAAQTVGGSVSGGGKTTGAAADKGGTKDASGTKTDSADTSGAAGVAAAGSVKINVPAASYYMLQYGVFSTEDGLTAAAAELRGKGLAASSLTSKDDYRIYVGMSTERDAAELLGQSLTGMDVYVKQVDLPSLKAIAYNGKASDAQTFFDDTSELLAKLDGMTVARLSAQTGSADGDWQALHQQWTESASRLESGMTDKANKEPLLKLIQAVNSAAVAAGEYGKKPSDAYLWSMQTALMNAVFVQKAWFESIESL